jgi:hypothetical protein
MVPCAVSAAALSEVQDLWRLSDRAVKSMMPGSGTTRLFQLVHAQFENLLLRAVFRDDTGHTSSVAPNHSTNKALAIASPSRRGGVIRERPWRFRSGIACRLAVLPSLEVICCRRLAPRSSPNYCSVLERGPPLHAKSASRGPRRNLRWRGSSTLARALPKAGAKRGKRQAVTR